MSDPTLDALLNLPSPPPVRTTTPDHPKGWEPGICWDGRTGEITALTDNPEWDRLLLDWGLNPTHVEVIPDTVQIRAWDTNVGDGEIRRLRYYKASVRARTMHTDRADLDKLAEQIARWRPSKAAPAPTDSGRALLVQISDTQAGKTDENGGSPELVTRYLVALDTLVQHVKHLRKVGRPVDSIYLIGMGDLVESCMSSHATQLFTNDLDAREQVRLVRRLLLRTVDALAPLAPRLVMSAVPGNHGENRTNGKQATRPSDNNDVAVVEQVWELTQANPERYPNVTAVFPDDYSLVLDVAGTVVGWLHGHGTSGGPTQMETWWAKQTLGRQPVGDATILVTGHYHHFRLSEASGRTWMQCPAFDPGSSWWTHKTGQSSPAGLLTFVAGDGCGPRGWDDLKVIQ